MKNFLSILLVVTGTLAGCGGGGGGGGGGGTDIQVSQQSAEGIWVGSTTSSNGVTSPAMGLILDTGEYFFATGSDYSGVVFGNATISGNKITSSNMKDYVPNLSSLLNGSLTGTVKTQSSLNVNVTEYFNGVTYTGTGTFSFDSQYSESSSLAKITGSYASPNAFSNQYTYSVDASGVLSGQTAKCTISGQISVKNASKNIYGLTLTTSNRGANTCEIGTRTLTGVATYAVLPNRTQRALALVAITNSGNTYYWFTAAGERI